MDFENVEGVGSLFNLLLLHLMCREQKGVSKSSQKVHEIIRLRWWRDIWRVFGLYGDLLLSVKAVKAAQRAIEDWLFFWLWKFVFFKCGNRGLFIARNWTAQNRTEQNKIESALLKTKKLCIKSTCVGPRASSPYAVFNQIYANPLLRSLGNV